MKTRAFTPLEIRATDKRNKKFLTGFTPLEIPITFRRDKKFLTGFTLIEAVMVILIIGILTALIMASANNSLPALRLEAAKWKLKTDIVYAQSLAVTQQVNHGIIFDPAGNKYSIYRQTTSNIVNDPLTKAAFTTNYSTDSKFQGVTLPSPSFGNRLEFGSFGTPSDGTNPLASNGTITLSGAGTTTTITVTKNTGKVN